MTDKEVKESLIREIQYPTGGEFPLHRLTIDPDAFNGYSSLVTDSPKRIDRKLNLRIRKEDNLLLKALAEQAGVKISTLLNKLLHDLLLDSLLSIEEEDVRALIAKLADDGADYDGFERPWCIEVAGHHGVAAIHNALEWNQLTPGDVQPPELDAYGMTKADLHSDAFNELMRVIEEKI